MLSSTLLFILVFLAGAPRRTPEHVLSASSLPTPLGPRSPISEYAYPGISATPALPVGELAIVPANPWDVRLARLQCSTILFGTMQHSACVERAATKPRSNGDRLSTRRKFFDLLDAQLAHRSASSSFKVDVLGALLWIAQVSVLSAVALSLFIHTSPTKVLSWITKTWLGTSALQDEVAHLLRTIARNKEAIAQTEFDIVSLQAETMLKENEHTQKKITTALLEGAKQDLLLKVDEAQKNSAFTDEQRTFIVKKTAQIIIDEQRATTQHQESLVRVSEEHTNMQSVVDAHHRHSEQATAEASHREREWRESIAQLHEQLQGLQTQTEEADAHAHSQRSSLRKLGDEQAAVTAEHKQACDKLTELQRRQYELQRAKERRREERARMLASIDAQVEAAKLQIQQTHDRTNEVIGEVEDTQRQLSSTQSAAHYTQQVYDGEIYTITEAISAIAGDIRSKDAEYAELSETHEQLDAAHSLKQQELDAVAGQLASAMAASSEAQRKRDNGTTYYLENTLGPETEKRDELAAKHAAQKHEQAALKTRMSDRQQDTAATVQVIEAENAQAKQLQDMEIVAAFAPLAEQRTKIAGLESSVHTAQHELAELDKQRTARERFLITESLRCDQAADAMYQIAADAILDRQDFETRVKIAKFEAEREVTRAETATERARHAKLESEATWKERTTTKYAFGTQIKELEATKVKLTVDLDSRRRELCALKDQSGALCEAYTASKAKIDAREHALALQLQQREQELQFLTMNETEAILHLRAETQKLRQAEDKQRERLATLSAAIEEVEEQARARDQEEAGRFAGVDHSSGNS